MPKTYLKREKLIRGTWYEGLSTKSDVPIAMWNGTVFITLRRQDGVVSCELLEHPDNNRKTTQFFPLQEYTRL